MLNNKRKLFFEKKKLKRTKTNLIRNTANVKKLIVINAVSDAGKSTLPWPPGERRIRRLFCGLF